MNLIFLGYPGSGKGTQAKLLAERKNFAHISTGDLFREEIAKGSELGKTVKGIISSGKLVSDQIVLKVIESKIGSLKNDAIFDGFPRTVEQAEGLEILLEKYSRKVDAVLFFEVDEKEVIKRLSARRSCSCGKVYNTITNPPLKEGICDSCGAELFTREDDKPEVISKRIDVYKDLTSPLISYYRTQGLFHIINASRPGEEVYSEIEKTISQAKI
ncbi:MAG: adenylate kinase [Elusimicrobia bacterium]|nr:adenylate kinase [Elusimicrobiota bacterium]